MSSSGTPKDLGGRARSASAANASRQLATSRLALLCCFALIIVITAAALVGSKLPLVIAIWMTDGAWLVPWLLTAWALGDDGRRLFVCDSDDPDDAALGQVTRVAIGLGALSLIVLGVGSLPGGIGVGSHGGAAAMLALGSIHAAWKVFRRRDALAAWIRGPAGGAWLALPVATPVGLMGVGALVLPGVLWGADDPAGYDVLAYHLQLPREWLELGRIATLRHNMFSFFPLNVEMHYLLALQLRGGAFAGMYLAQLMHACFVVLTIAGVYGAARPRGRLAAGVAAIVVAAVPWTFMLGGVAYDEGGLMLYATLAAAWALRGRWALAGACAGLAAGCKPTGLAVTVLLVPAGILSLSLWERARVRAFRSRTSLETSDAPPPAPPASGRGMVARGGLVFGAAALAAVSPWLLRTAIASGGNPVFPLAMNLLGHGHFDAGQIERFNIAHAPRADQQSIAGRLAALWHQVGDDYHFGTTHLGGIALPIWLTPIAVAIVLAARDREARRWLALLVGNVLIWLFATHLQGRFLVQAIPIGAMLVACGIDRSGGRQSLPPLPAPAVPRRHGVTPSSALPRATLVATLAVVAAATSWPTPLATLQKALPTLGVPGEPTVLRDLLPADVAAAGYDTTRPIVLVGDARAFWYAIPSARLRYRSVFDVPTNRSFCDAWLGDDVPADALVVVDPGELRRFARTYRNLPAMPAAWAAQEAPFVADRDGFLAP